MESFSTLFQVRPLTVIGRHAGRRRFIFRLGLLSHLRTEQDGNRSGLRAGVQGNNEAHGKGHRQEYPHGSQYPAPKQQRKEHRQRRDAKPSAIILASRTVPITVLTTT